MNDTYSRFRISFDIHQVVKVGKKLFDFGFGIAKNKQIFPLIKIECKMCLLNYIKTLSFHRNYICNGNSQIWNNCQWLHVILSKKESMGFPVKRGIEYHRLIIIRTNSTGPYEYIQLVCTELKVDKYVPPIIHACKNWIRQFELDTGCSCVIYTHVGHVMLYMLIYLITF
jgi:hypothetical protein